MKFPLLFLLFFSGIVSAADLFKENFETGSAGAFSVVASGASMSFPLNAQAGAIPGRSAFFNAINGEELKLEKDDGFSVLPANSFFEVSFDYYEPSGAGSTTVADAIRFRVGDAVGNAGTMIDLALYNGSISKSDGVNPSLGVYPLDTLVRIRLVINNTISSATYGTPELFIPAQTFDVFVGTTRVLKGVTFRSPIADPDGLSINKFSTGIQQAYVDNVLVSIEGELPAAPITVYPSFHAASLHWAPVGRGANVACTTEYRPSGTTVWNMAQPLPYIPWGGLYRGSVLGLIPGTAYEFRLSIPGGVSKTVIASTRSNTFPTDSAVVTLPATSSSTQTLSTGGTSSAWKVYTAAAGGSVIDVANAQDYAIRITKDYVILRGVTAKGGRIGVVQIADNVQHVVIEGCDLSNWGRYERLTFGVRGDPAIGGLGNGDVIIQGNLIHSPRWDANEWTEDNGVPPTTPDGRYYPTGAGAIVLWDSRGNVVVRYNHIDSPDDEFRLMDAIQILSYNQSVAPGRGTDVYCNKITNLVDDAIELEGWETNFRVWGNYIDRGYTSISLRTAFEGPGYVFRNVANRYLEIPLSKFGKTGSQNSGRTCGPQFWYHNTMLDAGPGNRAWQGIWYQHDTNQPSLKMEFLNNIIVTRDPSSEAFLIVDEPTTRRNDYDLYQGQVPVGSEPNGFNVAPKYRIGHGSAAMASGKYQLQSGTPGHDVGVRLANFNDDFLQSAPDIGVAENGAPPMKFGLEAYADMQAGYPVPGFVSFAGGGVHPEDDPDDDGVSALMEYALGGSLTARENGLPGAVGKTLSFSRNPVATNVTTMIEDSTDLSTWTVRAVSNGGAPFISNSGYGVSETSAGDAIFTSPEATKRFYRLRFEYP